MKYTLCCQPGSSFSPRTHFLVLGSWLAPAENRSILAHGNMTERKAQKIIKEEKVAVFKDCRYHIISIEGSYCDAYRRRSVDQDLQQFAGWLYQYGSNKIFAGELNL